MKLIIKSQAAFNEDRLRLNEQIQEKGSLVIHGQFSVKYFSGHYSSIIYEVILKNVRFSSRGSSKKWVRI